MQDNNYTYQDETTENQENLIVENEDFEEIPSSRKGNLPLAVVGGIVSSVLAASIWAAISVAIERQWGIMAIFAGLAVGFVVKILGRANSIPIIITGTFFALASCVLGDFLTNVGFMAIYADMKYFETLSMIDISQFFDIAFMDVDPISLFFYAIAGYEGYKICASS